MVKQNIFLDHIFIMASFLISFYAVDSLAITYGAYRTTAQGSARAISQGGAFAAEENDASSIWIVPAMLPLTIHEVDMVFTQGQAFSKEPTPQNGGQAVYISSSTTVSLAYTFNKTLSMAVGYGTPYSIGAGNPSFSDSALSISDLRFSLGYRFPFGLAIAPLISFKNASEKYGGYIDGSGNMTGGEQIVSAVDMGLSIAWQNSPSMIMSLSWEQPRTFNMFNSNFLTALGNGIQPAKIPSLLRYGASLKIPDIKMMITSQLDLWTDTAGLSDFIDSQFTTQQTNSVNQALLVPRVGLEYQFVDRFWVNAWVRTGGYVEQATVQQQSTRGHWTLGVESKLWIFDFTFGYDNAAGYANAVTSAGISLTDYL